MVVHCNVRDGGSGTRIDESALASESALRSWECTGMHYSAETTATQLHILLVRLGYSLSLCTILRCWMTLRWTFHGSAYSQLIREQNKCKRLECALKFKDDDFSDVVSWTRAVYSKKPSAILLSEAGRTTYKQAEVNYQLLSQSWSYSCMCCCCVHTWYLPFCGG